MKKKILKTILDQDFCNYDFKTQNELAYKHNWFNNPPALTKMVTKEISLQSGPINFNDFVPGGKLEIYEDCCASYIWEELVPHDFYNESNIELALKNYNIWKTKREEIALENEKINKEKQKQEQIKRKQQLIKQKQINIEKSIKDLEKLGYDVKKK